MREKIFAYIEKKYKATPEYPWGEDDGAVLRHGDNRKWFALVMNIGRVKLGLAGEDRVDVINLKIDDMVFKDAMMQDRGIFPAYHMNKEHWATLVLEQVDGDRLKLLLDGSFQLTGPKGKKGKNPPGLTSMKNIGKELARKLASVGAGTPQALREMGAKEAFARMRAAYPKVCLVHLYALEGAVEGVEYNALPQEVKADLKAFNDSFKEGRRS